MRVPCTIIALLILSVSEGSAVASDRNFGGYECTDDCSGHRAGYLWAELKGITDPTDCPVPRNSWSFHEGCLAYAEDPFRGADEDDDGEEIE